MGQTIPPTARIQEAFRAAWEWSSLTPDPRTLRLFSFEHAGSMLFARLNWAIGQLSAGEVVEFVDHLSRNNAPVPQIVPTRSGDLCVVVGDAVVLSVETDLGGQPCSSEHLHLLGEVGRGLARIHLASEKFEKSGMRDVDLTNYVEDRLRSALSRSLRQDLHESIGVLQRELKTTWKHLTETSVPWLTTHGDVWGPNVHADGSRIGFTDINCLFAPATIDLASVQHRSAHE